ncbi:hypothetical protein RKD35_002436 [Streptomyces albogriseolus]
MRDTVSSKGCRMPGSPASPRNSAHSDQPNAASVPTDTRVSMVAAPCRRLVQAARWKGAAPHTTTGAARVRESHCQWSNCSGGTIASRTTGRASSTETISRVRRAAVSGSVPEAVSSSSRRGGAGSSAV